MKGINKRGLSSKVILIPLTLALALIALIGCSVNADNLSIPNKINPDSIFIYNNRVILEKDNIHYGKVPDTGSMLPALPHNSTIFWITDFDELNVGDIVMANMTGENCDVMHRVIAINENNYVLKGDNNPFPDNCIYKKENIYALIVGVIY